MVIGCPARSCSTSSATTKLDAWQASILALDVLREQGDIYVEYNAKKNAPNVLKFEAELVADGRTLPRPVNTFWCPHRGPGIRWPHRSNHATRLSWSIRAPAIGRASAG